MQKPCNGNSIAWKKGILLSALFLFIGVKISVAQELVVNPAQPKKGELITFTYNPKGGKFANDTLITATVIITDGFDLTSKKIDIIKDGELYRGKFQTDTATLVIIFAFSANKVWDHASKEGYIYPIYDNTKPVNGALTAMADFYVSKTMKTIYAAEPDYQKAVDLLEKEMELYPQNKDKASSLQKYYGARYRLNPLKGKAEILAYIKSIDQQQQITDIDYYKKYRLYEILEMKIEMESALESISKLFPNSPVIFSRRYKEALTPSAAEEMEALGNKLIVDYDMIHGKQFSSSTNSVFRALNQAYLKEFNLPKFYFYLNKLNEPGSRLIDLISAATYLAETRRELAQAEKIANWGLHLIDTLSLSKSSLSPQRLKARRIELTGVLGRIYYERGQFDDAYTALKIAHQENSEKLAFIPVYYGLVLVKKRDYKSARPLLADAIKLGMIDDELVLAFKEAFINGGGTLSDYHVQLASLKEAANVNKKSMLEKIMQKTPAPNFTLMDNKGKRVSLSAYKGKIVVLDFWATWCVPCLEAFPGMNKLAKKYEDDKDVVFLFINTSETFTKDLTKNINSYLKKQGYNFHVLIDEKQVIDGVNTYIAKTLYNASAIPLKVVIDKMGNIRFRSTGYLGSDEKVVEELSNFIEAVKGF